MPTQNPWASALWCAGRMRESANRIVLFMSASPIASVIIAAFNAQKWIDFSVASAQNQTLKEIEIIVVDDGSNDDTAAVVDGIAGRDARVRLIRQCNAGVGAARNTGIRSAKGIFLAPLDADDVWEPEKLELQLRRMSERGERTALVYCWHRWIDEDGIALGYQSNSTVQGDARTAILLRNFIGNASVPLFRASAVKCVGPYLTRDEQGGGQGCEDWDLSIRVAERWEVGLADEVLVGYRQTNECMSSQVPSMAKSYQTVMDQARSRNRDLPEAIFRWAEGHFQSYLVSKGYDGCDYRSCINAAARAISSDPLLILNKRLHELTFKSLIWLATGKRRSVRHRVSTVSADVDGKIPEPHTSLLEKIQQRRWAGVVNQ